VSEYTIVTAREAERFRELSAEVQTASRPVFLAHDVVVARYWPLLAPTFPDYQFCLVEQTSGRAVARGNSIPVAFHDTWSSLPAEGLDWVLAQGFRDHAEGRRPTVLSALYIVVSDAARGTKLSTRMLATMQQIGRARGFDHLIAPVRPSMKSRYPLIAMADYCRWHTTHGEPFDPWLRVHVRAGGQVVHPCLRAMAVSGTRQQWTAWTGMDFPGDGSYVVPHALVPVTVRGAEGCYVEPGIWVVHGLREESAFPGTAPESAL